jgi:hypothetical protein
VQRSAFSHAQLMRVSTDRIELASRSADASQHVIAQRILATPGSWHSWELEHSGLMRQVADFAALRNQALALRRTALRLIHAKALFEYLKKQNVRGAARAQVIAHFHPTQIYEHAVVAEHTVYVQKAASYMCASHLGTEHVYDAAFLDPMQHYEELFEEYFEAYCASLMPGAEELPASQTSLLPLLKDQLNKWRWVILNPKQGLPLLRRESELRRPTGDTQRMKTLKIHRSK